MDIGYHNLSSTQKYLIRSGNHVPYNKQFVKRVVVGKARIMPNGAIINIPTGPEFVPSYYDLKYNPKWQLKEPSILGDITFDHSEFKYEASTQAFINLLFFASHAADIYTTYRGVKYECISEANPLLPTPQLTIVVGHFIISHSRSHSRLRSYLRQWVTLISTTVFLLSPLRRQILRLTHLVGLSSN